MANKTVLITGAAKRIGREIALSMAQKGWNIAIHYNNSAKDAEEVAAEVTKFGVKACLIQADLTNAEVGKIFAEANKKIGIVDCLVNNASAFKIDTINNVSNETWQDNIEVNLHAPIMLIQEFVKQLPEGRAGNVINMLDYAVWRYPEKFLSYTISKAGLWAATQQLAMYLAPKNIRINGIGPGKILPNSYENQEKFSQGRKTAPLGEDATPAEICHAIDFILTSPSMTGQMIALDGGKHLIGPGVY